MRPRPQEVPFTVDVSGDLHCPRCLWSVSAPVSVLQVSVGEEEGLLVVYHTDTSRCLIPLPILLARQSPVPVS